jgi:hypothetical protein
LHQAQLRDAAGKVFPPHSCFGEGQNEAPLDIDILQNIFSYPSI